MTSIKRKAAAAAAAAAMDCRAGKELARLCTCSSFTHCHPSAQSYYLVRPTASTSYDIVDAASSFFTYGRLCKEALS